MHSMPPRDGERPAEFRRITREQIAKYGSATFVHLTVMAVCKEKVGGYEGSRATDKEMIGQVRNWCLHLVVEI